MSRLREELSSEVAKDLLGGRENAAVILAASGDVEQTKQDALGLDTDGVIEISGDAFAQEVSCDVRSLNLGK